MWHKSGSIWIFEPLNFITIQPTRGPDGQELWETFCGGRPVPQIPKNSSLGELMMQTVKYYDDRIEMTPVKEPWNL